MVGQNTTPWNHISQNLTENTVKCHFHDLLMTLVHCWSWLLPVFMFLLEDQLSEPEIILMFKDKLKVSALGYQLEGREKGNMFSCKVGGQPLAVCVFPKHIHSWGRAARSGLHPMVFLFCLTAAFLSQQLKVLCHTLTASGFICPFLSGKQEWFLFSDLVEKALQFLGLAIPLVSLVLTLLNPNHPIPFFALEFRNCWELILRLI